MPSDGRTGGCAPEGAAALSLAVSACTDGRRRDVFRPVRRRTTVLFLPDCCRMCCGALCVWRRRRRTAGKDTRQRRRVLLYRFFQTVGIVPTVLFLLQIPRAQLECGIGYAQAALGNSRRLFFAAKRLPPSNQREAAGISVFFPSGAERPGVKAVRKYALSACSALRFRIF